MGAKCAEVLAVDHDIRTPSGGGHSAHAHHDHALRQICRTKFCKIEITELQLEVRADAVVERIAAKPLKAFAPHIERRMRNHRGKTEHPRPPLRSRTVAHSLRPSQRLHRLPFPHKTDVGVKRIYALGNGEWGTRNGRLLLLKCGSNVRQCIECAPMYRRSPIHRRRSGFRRHRRSPS